jgi:hypothetical protein
MRFREVVDRPPGTVDMATALTSATVERFPLQGRSRRFESINAHPTAPLGHAMPPISRRPISCLLRIGRFEVLGIGPWPAQSLGPS